jgi:Phage integrase, N-terminal SAM-like domain
MARKAGSRGWGHIRNLPSGNLQASYLNRGRRHYAPTTFTNSKGGKVRAEGWLASERALIEAGTWTPPADRAAARTIRAISLAEYAAKWIADRPVKARTRLLYESQLKHHIKPTIGTREITTVTPDAVWSWYAGLSFWGTTSSSSTTGTSSVSGWPSAVHVANGSVMTMGNLVGSESHINRTTTVL